MGQENETTYFRLKRVKINKMWGKNNIDIKINDINLFIGKNGSGKTTFINIIEAVASGDFGSIIRLNFARCVLYFENDTKIMCERFVDIDDNIITYTIHIRGEICCKQTVDASTDVYYMNRLRSRARRPFNYVELQKIRDCLNMITRLSWISVERSYVIIDDRYARTDEGVNGKLEDIIDKINIYQSEIEAKEKEVLETFRNNIFELMLYDEEFDMFDKISAPKDDSWVEQLNVAFNELGICSDKIKEKIKTHVTKMNEAFEYINNSKNIGQNIDNIFALPLFNRTRKIIQFSEDAEKNKQEIRNTFNIYLNTISEFLNKKINRIHKDIPVKGEKLYSISELSSGEKQMLILLSEALLQQNKNALFIADEPELSLHIDWQRKIIAAIHELNSNAQLIFATHSPEVVSDWQDYVINMENITK